MMGRPRKRYLESMPHEMTEEYYEFREAVEKYKQQSGVRFPALSEILNIFRELGYRKPPPIVFLVVLLAGMVMAVPVDCGCPGRPDDSNSLRLLFEIYREHTGQPYLVCICENWLRFNHPLLVRRQSGYIIAGGRAWELYGDLNRDCKTNWIDFAIYFETLTATCYGYTSGFT